MVTTMQRGHHYVQRGTDQIGPEVADAFFTNFHQAADQGKQHCNAAGGGNKVLYRQAQGLGQVGQSEIRRSMSASLCW